MTLHDPGLTLVAGFGCVLAIAGWLRAAFHLDRVEHWKAAANRFEGARNDARAELARLELKLELARQKPAPPTPEKRSSLYRREYMLGGHMDSELQ